MNHLFNDETYSEIEKYQDEIEDLYGNEYDPYPNIEFAAIVVIISSLLWGWAIYYAIGIIKNVG